MKLFSTQKPLPVSLFLGATVALIIVTSSLWAFTFPAQADGMGPTETPTATATVAVTASADNTQGGGYPAPGEGIQYEQLPTPEFAIQATQPPVVDVNEGSSFLLGPLILLLLALVAFGAIAFLLMRKR
ncbi:MAG: hypothetical protein ACOYYS_25400 [Chloroflexota bacterium]